MPVLLSEIRLVMLRVAFRKSRMLLGFTAGLGDEISKVPFLIGIAASSTTLVIYLKYRLKPF